MGWCGGEAGRCQIGGADDVGGCPVEVGCRGGRAAVEVEKASESSEEHDAQNCYERATEKLCDLRHEISLL